MAKRDTERTTLICPSCGARGWHPERAYVFWNPFRIIGYNPFIGLPSDIKCIVCGLRAMEDAFKGHRMRSYRAWLAEQEQP